jgi:hypothetical protein
MRDRTIGFPIAAVGRARHSGCDGLTISRDYEDCREPQKAADNVSLGGFQAGDDYALAPDFDRPSIKVLASLADRFFILVAFNDVRWCADAPSLV